MGKKKKGGKKKGDGGAKHKKGGKKQKKGGKKHKNVSHEETEEIEYLPEVIETRETTEFNGGAVFRSFALSKDTMQHVVRSYGHSHVTRSDLEVPLPPPPPPTEEELMEQARLAEEEAAQAELEAQQQEEQNNNNVNDVNIDADGNIIDENGNIIDENGEIIKRKISKAELEAQFQEALKKKSIITVAGVERWSKKKQFRHEVKEIFGGEGRNIPGFRTFTKDVDKSKMVKWEFHKT